jgi:hypothetical protein
MQQKFTGDFKTQATSPDNLVMSRILEEPSGLYNSNGLGEMDIEEIDECKVMYSNCSMIKTLNEYAPD